MLAAGYQPVFCSSAWKRRSDGDIKNIGRARQLHAQTFLPGNIRTVELVNHLTDRADHNSLRGGHARKVYAAIAATEHTGQRTVTSRQNRQSYGLGESGGRPQRLLTSKRSSTKRSCASFRARFESHQRRKIAESPFFRPAPDSKETQYLLNRPKRLGRFSAPANRGGPAT